MSVESLVENLSKLNVLELVELIKNLEEKWGVKAAAPMVSSGSSVDSAGASNSASEKSEFDVILGAVDNKIGAIKAVKDVLALGLTDAKAIVDKGPGAVLKTKVSKDEAQDLKKKLEDAGVKIELK